MTVRENPRPSLEGSPPPRSSQKVIGPYRRRLPGGLLAITAATLALFAVSSFIAPSSVTGAAVLSMFPFAAILALVALGQSLVVQQGGIDLSVPGAFSLAVVVITKTPSDTGGSVLLMAGLAIILIGIVGAVSGLLVAKVGLAPIVVTLGMNAVYIGLTWAISGGAARPSPKTWYSATTSSWLGIPLPVIIAVVATMVLASVLKLTQFGRELEAVGANPLAAAASGIDPQPRLVSAYAGAAVLYAIGGIVLAGMVNTPSISEGTNYLLSSVAVVVLGGTSLLGGKTDVFATVVAAVFFTQVDRMALTLGLGAGVQMLVQAAALAAGVLALTLTKETSRANT